MPVLGSFTLEVQTSAAPWLQDHRIAMHMLLGHAQGASGSFQSKGACGCVQSLVFCRPYPYPAPSTWEGEGHVELVVLRC